MLLGIQFWYADQGGVYVLWCSPLFLLMMFRPNLAERFPAPIHRETDWLYRSGRALVHFLGHFLKRPESAARVG